MGALCYCAQCAQWFFNSWFVGLLLVLVWCLLYSYIVLLLLTIVMLAIACNVVSIVLFYWCLGVGDCF